MTKQNETLEQRLWRSVDSSGGDDACWLWIAGTTKGGYGQITWHWKKYATHIVSYVIHHGPVPKGLWVLHSCDTKRCVNPRHLEAGTPKKNAVDAFARAMSSPNIAFRMRVAHNIEKRKERARRKAELEERMRLGLERPRDSFGRFFDGTQLGPRKRDARGYFIKA